ncbi:hypothetical protein WP2S18E08_43670 [Escherichia coli]|nr:hypothetical protein [Escherichia coli]BBQ64384.1 hypothetical protein WP2S18E08_43670 [Escherichia coli]SRB06615.1 Uncharacterised protein [Escherichia coli]
MACRKAGGDCGDIQNKYAVLSAENQQKLHIDVAADPLTALSGEDKWNIEGGLSAAGRPGWLYGSLTNQEVKDYVTEGNSYDLNYLNSNTSKSDRALAFFGEPENYWGTVAGAGSLLTSLARLSQLAGNLWIVFPPTVTIAVLFALFQQGLSLFNFTTQFFRTGTEQHPAQFFYLSRRCSVSRSSSSIFSSARASAERRKVSVSSTRLSCWSF